MIAGEAEMKPQEKLPAIVRTLAYIYDGWFVGSAADPANTSPLNYDVVLTLQNYLVFAHTINNIMGEHKVIVSPNTFGGWKIHQLDSMTIDVWADTLENLLTRSVTKFIWHPKSGVRWIKT